MPVVKKRNQQTETRLLLESIDPVELPPAEIDDRSVLVQFEKFKPFIPELLETLRAGTIAEPVPVMIDGSTFAIHGTDANVLGQALARSGQRDDEDRSRAGDQLSALDAWCAGACRVARRVTEPSAVAPGQPRQAVSAWNHLPGATALGSVMPELPEEVIALAQAVNVAGGRALLVGGCVRDGLMGKEPKDWDLEVYNLEPERLREVLDQFGPVNAVGESFTVYKLGPPTRHLHPTP